MHRDEKAVNMKDRQRMEQDIVRRKAPGAMQCDRIGRKIAMRKHGAFRPPGCAAGVDDRRQVVRRPADGLFKGRCCVGSRDKRLSILDEDARFGVAEKIVHFARRCRRN